ncbi:MAG: LamG domain-containing protein, partial [Candidatus Hodarchaeota archaeon]
MKFKKRNISVTSVFAIFLIIIQLILFINIPIFLENNSGEITNKILNKEKDFYDNPSDINETYMKPSEILRHNQKFNLSDWWNNTFRYRIGFKLENINLYDRYQPVDLYLTFRENEHYEGTNRLLGYNHSGNNEWTEPIPCQIWHIEKYPSTNFIKSCIVTFLANISAYSNKTYFLYYNDDSKIINDLQYDTNFSSFLSNGKLNVSVGASGSKYQAIVEESKGVSKLIRNNINFHLENSLIPQRQLTHPSLKLLAHCDEGVGAKLNDSSGNNLDGDFVGDTSWNQGILNYGINFDGIGDYIMFDDVLNNPFGSTSNAFTISTWIKPENLISTQSSHKTMNCFMAKASKAYNDNLELGIYRYNKTHGLLNVFIDTAGFHNQSIYGDISNPILLNEWNFIAVRYFDGDVDVRINDLWYIKDVNNSEPWEEANYLDQASGSFFTIGATINDDIYFNGSMDEIAIYDIALNDAEIEESKFGLSNSTIESIIELENGDVFSQYQINWANIFDMNIEDVITFYYNYNLWSINRTIYFDNQFDQNKALMVALNSYYNFSGVSDHQSCKYIYDGVVKSDITTTGFIAENYTIIYCDSDPQKDTVGIFIESYNVSNNLDSSINYLKGNVNYSNNVVMFTPGSINDFQNNGGGIDKKLVISFWEFIDSVNQTGNLNNLQISKYFNDIYSSLITPSNIHI